MISLTRDYMKHKMILRYLNKSHSLWFEKNAYFLFRFSEILNKQNGVGH